jgi:glyoxylase-like metal-dependent hydrolase (beta-lactamase superfamily II)
VVDTGTAGSAGQIAAALGALGRSWADVRHVVLTHHHPDHVGSLPEVLDAAPGAAAYAGAADIALIGAPNALRPVGDGDDVFGLQVIDTPGHTPGSISVLDAGIGLLIAGDALNGNDAGTAVLGPNPDFSADLATANASARKLASYRVEAAAFGHGNPVRVGAGPLLQELAASL